MEALKKFDLHPKTRSEFKTRTISGALASVWAVVSITYLVLAELRYSRQVRVVDRLWVNSTHGAGVNVSFDLEFPGIACDLVSVDAMDQVSASLPRARRGRAHRGGGGRRSPSRRRSP